MPHRRQRVADRLGHQRLDREVAAGKIGLGKTSRFERLLVNERVLAFLGGAAPGATGAIVGAAVPLSSALGESWQYLVLACAAVALIVLRRRVVSILLLAGCAGTAAALLGAPIQS